MAPDLLSTIRREIDERLSELRPLLAEREQLLGAIQALEEAAAAGVIERAASGPAKVTTAKRKVAKPAARDKPKRAVRGVARETILAALDHGSHTVSELAIVTAMSGPSINSNLRKLVAEGAIVKTEREGKAAWALPEAI
jgi:hypothetical protein